MDCSAAHPSLASFFTYRLVHAFCAMIGNGEPSFLCVIVP